jgi:hypothetical protein
MCRHLVRMCRHIGRARKMCRHLVLMCRHIGHAPERVEKYSLGYKAYVSTLCIYVSTQSSPVKKEAIKTRCVTLGS